jgi:hypothetical protein
MKKWNDAFSKKKLISSDSWKKMNSRSLLNNGENIEYGIGVYIKEHKGLNVVSHLGGNYGYSSAYYRIPEEKLSVVILSNIMSLWLEDKAYELIDIFLKDKVVEKTIEPNQSKPIDFPLDKLSGTYELVPGKTITLSVNGTRLDLVQNFVDDPGYLERKNKNVFVNPINTECVFLEPDSNGFAQKLLIDNKVTLKRTEDIDISKVNLIDYCGKFFSKELDRDYEVTSDNSNLIIKIEGLDPLKFYVTGDDKFGMIQDNFEIRLNFDRIEGKITGFYLNTFRIKGIHFVKKNNSR